MHHLLLLLIFISLTLSQNTESLDVVYLKDGSIIKGKIIEIIPTEVVKIETIGGNIFVFKMSEVKEIKKETVSLKEDRIEKYKSLDIPNKYKTQINIGRFGWASVCAATLIGSAAMGDDYFGTTVIPVVGPFVTIIRIENDPNAYYLPGGKELLLTSGILQVSFFSYWMYYVIKDAKYKSSQEISIRPNVNNFGLTLSYNFKEKQQYGKKIK